MKGAADGCHVTRRDWDSHFCVWDFRSTSVQLWPCFARVTTTFCYVVAGSDIVRDAEKSNQCRRASPERVGVDENGRRSQTSA